MYTGCYNTHMLHSNQNKILELAKKVNLADLTLQQIAKQAGIDGASNQLISFHIEKLKKKGYLNAQGQLMEQNPSLLSIPFFGTANAGPATFLADDHIQGYVKVSKSLLGSDTCDCFSIKASGNSMNREKIDGKQIKDGDYLIVKKTNQVQDNDVIITLVEGLVNIKKYKKIDAHTVALISNSSELYPPIYLTAKDNPQIVGKVIKVLAAADII